MSRADGWMPLWIGDYLADTMHLTGAEHGAYLLLLMHSWRNGPLPDDDRQLAAIARTDRPSWKEMAPTIRAFFSATPGGLVQKRLEAERENAAGNAERRSEAARTAATKRWQGNANAMRGASDTHARRNASRMPGAMRDECPTPSPSPSSPDGEENPLTPTADAAGGLEASQSGRPRAPKGSRSAGTNPRAVAAAERASRPPPPEPDHPLWPRCRALDMTPDEFRRWVVPLVEVAGVGGQRVLVAPSRFHADHVRREFGAQHLAGFEVRANPEAAHG